MTSYHKQTILKMRFRVNSVLFLVFRVRTISSYRTVEKLTEIWSNNGRKTFVRRHSHDLLRNSILSSLAYAIVSVDNHITYVTNELLTSKHDCMEEKQHIRTSSSMYFMRTLIIYKIPKRLTCCKYFSSKNSLKLYMKNVLAYAVLYKEISPMVAFTYMWL